MSCIFSCKKNEVNDTDFIFPCFISDIPLYLSEMQRFRELLSFMEKGPLIDTSFLDTILFVDLRDCGRVLGWAGELLKTSVGQRLHGLHSIFIPGHLLSLSSWLFGIWVDVGVLCPKPPHDFYFTHKYPLHNSQKEMIHQFA